MVHSPVHNSLWVKPPWLPFRHYSLFWCLRPPGFWWVSTSTWCLLLWGPRYVMVSYCHSWPVDEATSELSDAGAPFTSAFLMALVNRVFSGFPCGTLPSGGAFDLTLSSHSSMPTFPLLFHSFLCRLSGQFRCFTLLSGGHHFLQALKSQPSRDFSFPLVLASGLNPLS